MIKTNTIAAQHWEFRQAFLRRLPRQIEAVAQRIERYLREGWEPDGLAFLNDDVQRLAGPSSYYGLIQPSQHLLTLEYLIGEHIAGRSLPDRQQMERMLALLATVNASLTALLEYRRLSQESDDGSGPAPWHDILIEVEPDSLPPPLLGPATPAATKTSALPGPTTPAPTTARRILHLSDRNALALASAQRLEVEGYRVEAVETVDALSKRLMDQTTQLVLVDASHLSDLAAVGAALGDAQQRSHRPNRNVLLVAMADQDNLQSRLEGRRAGVDALLFPPFDAIRVARQLHALLAPVVEDSLRVLIVEDDLSQALFAQSVLIHAGMQAQVEHEPKNVLSALESLRPDLVLMDLNMAEAGGARLTALIREHPSFQRTPIVFLCSEGDPAARFDADDADGNGFLAKPIRPKDLVAAVHHRVPRAHRRNQPDLAPGARDVATSLYRREFLLDRINDALGTSFDQLDVGGGALFLEIDDAVALRDRLGPAVFEHLMVATGRVLADTLGEQHVAALFNDYAFVVLATGLDDCALDALAQRLRDQLLQHPFEADGEDLRLRASVGICPLRCGFIDASALLNAAERTCRDARASTQGIQRYESPKAAAPDQEAMLIEQLREAIRHDGFGLIFQPIAAMQGGQEAQYQTLLRMRDATGRLHPAAEILPLAERAMLMTDIDRWVLTRAMDVLREQRISGHPVRLFIPQAKTTFATQHQDGWLKGELATHGVPGEALVLECRLEDALLFAPALVAMAEAVQDDGVQLCLDQYEHTADASRLLDEIPLGFIKLAAKYVAANVPDELRNELHVLIEHAHRHGIKVIGHRVEDAQAAVMLWMSGIDYIQGNLVHGAAGTLDFDFNAAVL